MSAKPDAGASPNDRIDRLLHDAEQADAGANFAGMMMQRDPNPAHRAARDDLRNKAAALLAEAQALDPNKTAPAWAETDLT